MNSGRPQWVTTVKLLVLLFVRGVLLWLVVPVAIITWPVVLAVTGRDRPSLGAYIGWADLNLIAALHRCLPAKHRPAWTPFRAAASVKHRVGVFDPF